MLTLLAATPNWWDMPGYSCLRQVSMDTSKDVDLDVLQAGINLSHRDKLLRDRATRRVAMKRLYQRHPVSTLILCQEGVSKCSDMMGATFILFLILYRIWSKQSRAQAARIETHNRAAVVHAVKADQAAIYCPKSSSHHKAGHRLMTKLSAAIPVCNCKASQSAKVTTTDLCPRESRGIADSIFKVKGRAYLLVVIRQLLLMSGDVELNPGPLDSEYWIIYGVRM